MYCDKGNYELTTEEYPDYYEFELDLFTKYICEKCCKLRGIQTEKERHDRDKKNEVSEDDKIYVTSADYALFNFARKNWICKLVYKMEGKNDGR